MLKSDIEGTVNRHSRREWEDMIYQWVHNHRDRALLVRRLLDGITYEALAEEFGLSTQQVKGRIYRAQEQLFKHVF